MSEERKSMQTSDAVNRAREYYNSSDADNFYARIWGGEDIHIGLYDSPDCPIGEAGVKTVEAMLALLPENPERGGRLLDIGAGYGGSARRIVKTRAYDITCLNLSEIQNERNRRRNQEEGLEDRIEVIDGDFENLPFEAGSFDAVWCQDSILHSGNRRRVFEEVDRVLKPGGHFVFTDIMQTPEVDAAALADVYKRIHLDSLGSVEEYNRYAESLGWSVGGFADHSQQLTTHYLRVHDELAGKRSTLDGGISDAYIDNMLQGLQHWVGAGQAGSLRWGILHYIKGE